MGEYDRCVFDSDAFCESLLPGDPVLVVGGQYNGARVTFVRLTPKKSCPLEYLLGKGHDAAAEAGAAA